MPWLIPVGIGAGSIIASIWGSKKAAEASQEGAVEQANAAAYAAELQQQSAREANALQAAMYEQGRTDTAPWREVGAGAIGALEDLVAPGGKLAEDFSYKDFDQKDWQDPGYGFRMAEGQKALERSASARGGLLSGGALKELTRYAQGTASDEYARSYDRYNTDYTRAFNTFNSNKSNLFNRLSSLAGTGQQSVAQMGQLGANYANQAGGNLQDAAARAGGYGTDAAAARASGYVGAANAWNQGLGNALNQAAGLYKIWGANN